MGWHFKFTHPFICGAKLPWAPVQGYLGEPPAGLDWYTHQLLIPVIPRPGSGHTWEERNELPSWWQEFCSIHHKSTKPLGDAEIQELANKQMVAFQLLEAQNEKYGWWNVPPSLTGLRWGDFLPPFPTGIQVPRDIHVVRFDETVALAQDLLWCAIQMVTPPGVLCTAIQDLQSCLAPLMERGDLLHLSMLEVAEEEETTTSPSPVEETRSLDEDPEPWEEWPTSVPALTAQKRLHCLKKLAALG